MASHLDFQGLDDEALLAFAKRLGINTQDFSSQPLPGLLNFGQSPGLAEGTPDVTISPEARGLVSTEFDALREQGQANLLRLATDAAGRRGLNLQDSPIADALFRGGRELETQLGGAEASALLGLNTDMRNFIQNQRLSQEQALTNRSQIFNQGNQFNQNLQLSLSEFQNRLRQQSFNNRLNLAGLSAQTGLV